LKLSGLRHIIGALKIFIEHDGAVKFIVGIDHRGTSSEGLSMLLNTIPDNGEVWITHNENPSTFHPKIYLFENEQNALILL
jgi:hypothetical protein